MMLRDKIAGSLMAFGLIGLAISPWALTPAANASGMTAAKSVSVAISSGPQLRLLRTGDPHKAANDTVAQAMHCRSVYRLSIADVGLGCRIADRGTRLDAFALAGPR